MTAVPGSEPTPDNDVDSAGVVLTPATFATDATPGGGDDRPGGEDAEITEDYAPTDSLAVPQHDREDSPSNEDRLRVLKWLVLLVAGTVLAAVVAAIFGSDAVWTRMERLVTLVISPIIALLATGIGWYFGKHGK